MADAADDPLRIALIMREPMGTLYVDAQQVINQLGHRLVGVLTSPGPRTRRSLGYREIVAQTPLSTDVIISNFPARWTVQWQRPLPD